MMMTQQQACQIGQQLGVDWDRVDLEQFRQGLEVELEHGQVDAMTNVTDDDLLMTGKIALAHLNELPDYYTRLARMEQQPARNNALWWGMVVGAAAVLISKAVSAQSTSR